MIYEVDVHQRYCGPLTVVEVAVEDCADPDLVRLVVYALKPGT